VIYELDRAGLGFGENVIVQGAGGPGLIAVAVAKAHGAGQVIVVDLVPGTGWRGRGVRCVM
jgi:threonine dehydrogenase-like Zn-dependent dehydrogenase